MKTILSECFVKHEASNGGESQFLLRRTLGVPEGRGFGRGGLGGWDVGVPIGFLPIYRFLFFWGKRPDIILEPNRHI